MPRTRLAVIALASACLILGLILPVMRVEKLFFFTETPSILQVILALLEDGDRAIASLVACFSILFPIAKLAFLAWSVIRPRPQSCWVNRALPHLSKWSMIDVTVVAIAIFAAKTSGFASAVSQPGLWFYAAAVLISGILVPLIPAGPANRMDKRTVGKSSDRGPKDLK